jgi:hypothetical protein
VRPKLNKSTCLNTSGGEIMRGLISRFHRTTRKVAPRRSLRPTLEGLEGRLLLYSTLGDMWTYNSRITYSFMPDGTNIGGTGSVLFGTLNAIYPTVTWQQQFERAAALWEGAANVNLALVSDGGEPVGVSGDQQDDPRFGDIRIGAIPLGSGVLAQTFLPPAADGGTDAGDIIFNSSVNWQINSTYDIMTVAAHEFGHALGLGGSTVSTAAMYGTYNGIKQTLTTDDINGIDSIYGAPQFDRFNSGVLHTSSFLTATNLNSYITSNAQISLGSLDITTCGQSEWFTANVPSTTTGTMTVTVQSSNLSSFAPKLIVYNSSLGIVGQVSAPNTLGATISLTVPSVQAGQQYYFKVLQAGGPGPIGAYGLLVNFGNQSQAPIAPPNTLVPGQPDQGGGVIDNAIIGGNSSVAGAPRRVSLGNLQVWAVTYTTSPTVLGAATTTSTTNSDASPPVMGLPQSSISRVATAKKVVTSSAPVVVPLRTDPSVFQAPHTALGRLATRLRRGRLRLG